ncbi:hypothetical protein DSM14862_03822 (plasmid) [Sulfitobacter indolifex]|uniref:Uncharacterized protein n=1 Tax=Sulfitobacter indolifex HEL-45 TaxID=391624 RepID=A0ABM9X1E1_9RHOB|nr:hypothetical protein OIHEL45_19651 [Sulfitobacter indolifex HEL-45]UOA20983.1 hypothetical protein DSM14862_03822 [Sulfitobacter indolifex]
MRWFLALSAVIERGGLRQNAQRRPTEGLICVLKRIWAVIIH